jgi:hypothetical protein
MKFARQNDPILSAIRPLYLHIFAGSIRKLSDKCPLIILFAVFPLSDYSASAFSFLIVLLSYFRFRPVATGLCTG